MMNTVGIKKVYLTIEGGCYAKAINLSKEKETQIYNAIEYGTVLENTVVKDDGTADFEDNQFTENTRAAYPINHIDNIVLPSKAAHSNTIIFLTADAFGVIPPIPTVYANLLGDLIDKHGINVYFS